MSNTELFYFSSYSSFLNLQNNEDKSISKKKIKVPFNIPEYTINKISKFLENYLNKKPNNNFINREWFDCFLVLDYFEPFNSQSQIWEKFRFLTLFSINNNSDPYQFIIFHILYHYREEYQNNKKSYPEISLDNSISFIELFYLITNYFKDTISINTNLTLYDFFINHLFLIYQSTIINYHQFNNLIFKPKLDLYQGLIKMSGHNWLSKLPKLKFNKESKLFISGGSLVYSYLKKKIPPSSDIDIWITGNNYDTNLETWKILLNFITNNIPGSIIKQKGSVTTIIPYNPYPPIQIIMTGYNNPSDIINNFDLSYVCAYIDINNLELYMNLGCMYSWNTMTAFGNNTKLCNIKDIRLAKTKFKGFSLGIFPNLIDKQLDYKTNYPIVLKGKNNLREIENFYQDKNANYFENLNYLLESEIYPTPFKNIIQYSIDTGCQHIDNPDKSVNIVFTKNIAYQINPFSLEENDNHALFIFNFPEYLSSPKLSFRGNNSVWNQSLSLNLFGNKTWIDSKFNHLQLPSEIEIKKFLTHFEYLFNKIKESVSYFLNIKIENLEENNLSNYIKKNNKYLDLNLKFLNNPFLTNSNGQMINIRELNFDCFVETDIIFHHFIVYRFFNKYLIDIQPKIIAAKIYQ